MCVVALAAVALTEPIRVEVQPQSQSSSEGGVVSLMCQASGPPGLGYQWFKGKEEVRVPSGLASPTGTRSNTRTA